MPIIHHHISALRTALQPYRDQKNIEQSSLQRIALVPTMGNLHDGHLELVRIAKQQADIVVVSIFVNPTQFGAGEDFDSYPRTLDKDVAKLTTVDADFVFAPSIDEMYPVLPPPTSVRAGAITAQLCGQSRLDISTVLVLLSLSYLTLYNLILLFLDKKIINNWPSSSNWYVI